MTEKNHESNSTKLSLAHQWPGYTIWIANNHLYKKVLIFLITGLKKKKAKNTVNIINSLSSFHVKTNVATIITVHLNSIFGYVQSAISFWQAMLYIILMVTLSCDVDLLGTQQCKTNISRVFDGGGGHYKLAVTASKGTKKSCRNISPKKSSLRISHHIWNSWQLERIS